MLTKQKLLPRAAFLAHQCSRNICNFVLLPQMEPLEWEESASLLQFLLPKMVSTDTRYLLSNQTFRQIFQTEMRQYLKLADQSVGPENRKNT